MNYIVPEYYNQFKCKCGDCRHSCCDGWPIRISMKEYYKLLGVNCSETLRAKLDCALKLIPSTNQEASAQLSTDWRGTCMLHREDGLCMLQVELGENSLPEVCRIYPRNTKHISEKTECSCSNSCEGVVDLLMKQGGPLKFIEMDSPLVPIFRFPLPSEKYEICKKSIPFLQDRSKPLSERFINLGSFLHPENQILLLNHYSQAFHILNEITLYYKNSSSICDYCQEIHRYYGINSEEDNYIEAYDVIYQKYQSASLHMDQVLPDWHLLLEQLMVNHMFYNNFPYADHMETVSDAYLALVLTYSYLRFHILGYMFGKTDLNLLVDFVAAMFRLIEHSNFKSIIVRLFKKFKYPVNECIPQLLNL